MVSFIIKRLLLAIPVIFGVTVVIFLMIHLIPGDPVLLIAGEEASIEEMQQIRVELGLDQPLIVQYVNYIKKLFKGDLGRSLINRMPVYYELTSRMPATLQLTFTGLSFAIILGIPIGIFSAIKKYTVLDHISMAFALFWLSMPIFWVGIMLVLIFGLELRLLPISGMNGPLFSFAGFKYFILPAITLGGPSMAMIARLTRSSVLDELKRDHVLVARSKGLKEKKVVIKHVLRNALAPVITYVGLQFGALLGGAVVVESIFAWPGVGRYILSSIQARDYPAIQGAILLIAVGFVLINIIVDIIYGLLDPRIRVK